jgi:hypothetical protein
MQDVESHDVYFVDHLHHFCTSHVEWVANHAGLAQVAICRSPWFAPNASVHVFEPAQQRPEIRRLRSLALEQAVAYWERVFANCRSIPRGCYAIFGGGEFAGLLRCYGGLDRFGPAFVLDDRPERYPDGALGLPVFALDARTDADLDGIDAVILALNPVYHASVRRRCADRGIAVINPFEAPARV